MASFPRRCSVCGGAAAMCPSGPAGPRGPGISCQRQLWEELAAGLRNLATQPGNPLGSRFSADFLGKSPGYFWRV